MISEHLLITKSRSGVISMINRLHLALLAGLIATTMAWTSAPEAQAGHGHRYGRGYYANYYGVGYYGVGYYGTGYRATSWGVPYYHHGSLYGYPYYSGFGGYRPSYSYGLYSPVGYPVVSAPYGYTAAYDYAPYRAVQYTTIGAAPHYTAAYGAYGYTSVGCACGQ
jgi:hypothetical protein